MDCESHHMGDPALHLTRSPDTFSSLVHRLPAKACQRTSISLSTMDSSPNNSSRNKMSMNLQLRITRSDHRCSPQVGFCKISGEKVTLTSGEAEKSAFCWILAGLPSSHLRKPPFTFLIVMNRRVEKSHRSAEISPAYSIPDHKIALGNQKFWTQSSLTNIEKYALKPFWVAKNTQLSNFQPKIPVMNLCKLAPVGVRIERPTTLMEQTTNYHSHGTNDQYPSFR